MKKSKTKKLSNKKVAPIIEKSPNKEVSNLQTEHKHDVVPSKLGTLTIKKNKSSHYDVFNKDKKLIASMCGPSMAGQYVIPTWGVFSMNADVCVLEEVFASLDQALVFIQKKYSKK